MSWPEAVEQMFFVAGITLVICVFVTGKWPWHRD